MDSFTIAMILNKTTQNYRPLRRRGHPDAPVTMVYMNKSRRAAQYPKPPATYHAACTNTVSQLAREG